MSGRGKGGKYGKLYRIFVWWWVMYVWRWFVRKAISDICVMVSDVCVTVICMCGGVCICTVICEHSPPLVHHSPPLAHHKPSLVHHSPPLAHHKPSDNNFITVLQHTITSPYIHTTSTLSHSATLARTCTTGCMCDDCVLRISQCE